MSKEINVCSALQVNTLRIWNNKAEYANPVVIICTLIEGQLVEVHANKNYLVGKKIIHSLILIVMIIQELNNFTGNNLKFVMTVIKEV
jgi:hypothetical protein